MNLALPSAMARSLVLARLTGKNLTSMLTSRLQNGRHKSIEEVHDDMPTCYLSEMLPRCSVSQIANADTPWALWRHCRISRGSNNDGRKSSPTTNSNGMEGTILAT